MDGKSGVMMVVIGTVGFAFLAILMMYLLNSLQTSPRGAMVKAALELAREHEIEGVSLVQAPRARGEKALIVRYRTTRRIADENEEMDRVARSAFGKVPEAEQGRIKIVEVTRVWEGGPSCWKSRSESGYQWDPALEEEPVEAEE